MTVPNDFNTKTYQLNGSATQFATEFPFFEDDQILVYLIEDEDVTQLTEGADYSVSGAGEPGGGIVTYPLGGPAGDNATLTIERMLPIIQGTSLRNQGAYFPENVEQAIDESRMIDQQQQDALDRTLKRELGSQNWDAQGRRIRNVGDAVDDGDAANLRQLNDSADGSRTYTDQQVGIERDARIAADEVERIARVNADANLQAQLSNSAPLEASAFSPISWHAQEVQSSVNIPNNVNAWSFGPTMTVAEGQTVTVGENSFWTIANGEGESGGTIEPFNGNYDYGVIQ